MNEVNLKCKKCDKLGTFVAYEERESSACQFVCLDSDTSHCELLPFIGRMRELGIRERLIFNRRVIVGLLTIALLSAGVLSFVYSLLVGCIFFLFSMMITYVFIQLYIIDMSLLRFYEVSFSNEQKSNLENLSSLNPWNRPKERFVIPSTEAVCGYGKKLILNLSCVWHIMTCCYKRYKRIREFMSCKPTITNENNKIRSYYEECMEMYREEFARYGLKIIEIHYQRISRNLNLS